MQAPGVCPPLLPAAASGATTPVFLCLAEKNRYMGRVGRVPCVIHMNTKMKPEVELKTRIVMKKRGLILMTLALVTAMFFAGCDEMNVTNSFCIFFDSRLIDLTIFRI